MSRILIVGADVSKGYADFIVIDENKKIVLEAFQLDDNKAGHDQLEKQLLQLNKEHGPDRFVLVLESTGGFEDNWLRCLKAPSLEGFMEGHRLNAKAIHHEYQIQKRSSISDSVSSLTIACHVAKNLELFAPVERYINPELKAARDLIRHIVSLEKTCTVQKNSLLQLLYRYLPSIASQVPDGWPQYFLNMLIEYRSKKSLQSAAARGFRKLSRVPKGKAKAIHEALRDGIDMEDTPLLVATAMASKARQILETTRQIKALENLLCQQAPVDAKQVELLCSIRGMGKRAATILLCFIEDIDRFENASSMAAFFGVQPRHKTSGDGTSKVKMSKQGSPIVRRELYLLGFRTLEREPYLKSIYAKFRKKGMNHDQALGVLMHKLTRIVYGMLKSGSEFDPGVDQLNQVDPREEKTEASVATTKTDPKRRFQPASEKAPISNRQRRKRKKDQESQAAIVAESTGSS